MACTLKCTSEVPVPAPSVTLSHELFEVAVQAHVPSLSVRWNWAVCAAADTSIVPVGVTEAWQPLSCKMVKVRPPTSMLVFRGGPEFGLIPYESVADPVPLGVPIVIHASCFCIVHGHWGSLATSAKFSGIIPIGPSSAPVGLSKKVQPLGCVTVTVVPAMMIVPLRATPAFGLTVNVTEPEPVVPALTLVMNEALLLAVQSHVGLLIVTLMVVEPPLVLAGTACVDSVATQPVA